jgi:RNA polymerase sigma-70 factor, ECF subfamily
MSVSMERRSTTNHQRSDEELIAEFQAGKTDAFTILVGRYKDPLTNYVVRFVGDRDAADDVVQDVFVRVFRKKDAYRPVAKFSTWIYTIAANLSKTELRRRRKHIFFSLSRGKEDSDRQPLEIPDLRFAADTPAETESRNLLIQQALDALNPKFKEILILADIQDLTYEEIAAITGMNIGTVKSRLNRARAKLQKMLRHTIEIEERS